MSDIVLDSSDNRLENIAISCGKNHKAANPTVLGPDFAGVHP
jgi:hypothetical protein